MTSKIRITKRSMDYSEGKLAKWGKFGSPKDPWTKAYENPENGWFTSFGAHFTLKMGLFADRHQPTQ
ncbi:hypothetical protein H5410_056458 [Solanum commersonii]|uniref:Uncharacterized protein n=1 Tax=Solanum commersonii TaxID=4109 RepID=A0A9J5WMB3_SOLCO|nr:hypothetical protein H5410_056458 [Solanum commersonii]